jgi:hypothetical protein
MWPITHANLINSTAQKHPNWGAPVAALFATGPAHTMSIIQYQLVQSAPERIDFLFVSATPLCAAQERRLTQIVRRALGHPFEVCFQPCQGSIPLPASGKFEEFVNLLC